MTDLASLDLASFSPLLGEAFRVRTDGGDVDLVLQEANAMGKAVREGGSFSLVFRGPDDRLLEQQLCTLHHPALGELGLFLVPIGPLAEGMGYEAIFT